MDSHEPLPTEYCDVVMKGGITSGVVYPLTAVELAKRYTFKNVGGTSAGAIAAAVTAAAEYRRRQGSSEGFTRLSQLPDLLGAPGFLLSLFTPEPDTQPLFRALLGLVGRHNPIAAVLRTWFALVVGFWKSSLLGAVLGAIVPYVLWRRGDVTTVSAVVLGALWVLVAATAGAVIAAAITLPKILRENRFGLCLGFRRKGTPGQPPLINWLYGFLNEVAGLPLTTPLTFRHLHEAPVLNDVTATARTINLEMITTNITHGRPHRLPMPDEEANTFYFSPVEWEDFFPAEVIEHLKRLAPPDRQPPTNAEGLDLYALPAADLPVVVATRLSLSFPVLFSAVPLWSVDFTMKSNQNLPPGTRPTAERCWFSDGGISSDFPVHLFDAPLPRWPTFAVNLKSPHPNFTEEADFVWLPSSNGAGVQPRWNRFDTGSAADQLGGYAGALFDSLHNWRDNLAARMPGYRNRVIHISLKSDEGGLNLDMPPDVIARLSDRGWRAGATLRTAFDFDNHVWVRYRVFVSTAWELLRKFGNSYNRPMPQDEAAWRFVKGTAPPPPFPGYPLPPADAAELAAVTANLVNALDRTPAPAATADEVTPKPRPELRQVPRV